MKTVLTTVMILTMGANAGASNSMVDAIKADVPPTIDGTLNDAVWQKGAWSSGLSRLNRADVAATVQTHFKVAIDETAIYLAVRADEPDLARVVKNTTERDGTVTKDDCVEFMLGADPKGNRYVHVIVNALGTIYDSECFDEGRQMNAEWNSAITVAAGTEKAAWTVEMRLPLADMGITSSSGDTWLFNLTRQRYTGYGRDPLFPGFAEQSTFAPLGTSFHQPRRFAKLRLPPLDLSALQWVVETPSELQYTPTQGSLTCSAQIQIENQTGRARSILLRPVLSMDGQSARGPDVAAACAGGARQSVALVFPVPKERSGILSVELRDGQHPETIWTIRQFTKEFKYVPLVVELLRPSYRNNIYATESIREIRASARLAVSEEARTGTKLQAVLARAAHVDAPIAKATFDVGASHVDMVLPIPELETGPYELTVTLQRNKDILGRSKTVIKKLAPVANEWRIDGNNILLHNGKPFLPFGWYSPEIEVMTDPHCPFNAAQQYGACNRTTEELRTFLDPYAAAGKVVMIDPFPRSAMWSPRTAADWRRPLTEEETAALRQRVRDLKDHPGILAWYMADEPEGKRASLDRVRQVYDIVSDEDPYHPCVMLNNTITGIYTYPFGGDILLTDPYPQFLKNGLASIPIEKITRFVTACNDASHGKKPTWLCPQVFNYNDLKNCSGEGNRAPDFTELRNQFYQGVVRGVKGFLSYTYSANPHYMGIQVGMPFLAKEMADLKEAIIAPVIHDAIEVRAEMPEHMHVSTRRVGDVEYVFAVNTATKAQQAQFRFKGETKHPGRLYVVSEDRSLTPAGDGAFSDHFALYATHIYASDARLAKRETLAAADAEIARRDAARRKPGNLAFEGHGTRVSDSSKLNVRSTPEKLFDGVYGGRGWLDGTSGKLPDWVEIAWPKPTTVGRIDVVSETARELAVLAPDGGHWKEIAAVSEVQASQATLRFSPIATDRLRVEVRKNHPGQDTTIITEIEAYAE